MQDEAGLKIQDATGFSIGNLTVTGPTLDKNLETLADHVTFHPLKDKKGGWSFQGSLCNLDLTSPQNFMHSLQHGVQQAVRSALAAEITHQAGGKGILPSAAGILAGLNHAQDGTTQDVNITGGFSFKDGKRDFDVPFVNFNLMPTPSLPFLFHNQQDSQDSLENLERNIFQALQQEGATEDEANTVLNDPDLRWSHGQGQSFDEDWHHRIEVERVLPEPGIINASMRVSEEIQPTPSAFLHQALSSCEQAALTLDRFAQAHPTLTKYAVLSLQMGLGGPTNYLVREITHHFAGDQAREIKQAGVEYLSRQLNISEQNVEVATSVINFGLSLVFDKVKGVLKDAQKVSQVLKNRTAVFSKSFQHQPQIPSRNMVSKKETENVILEQTKKVTESGFGVTKHAVSRKIERNIKSIDEMSALKNPLKVGKIKIDHLTGKQSQRFINEKVEVVINPQTKKIISSNPTRANTLKKLLKEIENKK